MEISALIYNKLIDPLLSGCRKLIKEQIDKDSILIDIASGTGELVRNLSTHCREVTGIDLDAGMIRFCIANIPAEMKGRIQFFQMDALKLSENLNRKYDYASMSMALHQFHSSQRSGILEEAKKVSDKLIIADYNLNLPTGFLKYFVFVIERMAGKEHYKNFLSFRKEGGAAGILTKNKFKILSKEQTSSEVFTVLMVSKS